VLTCFGELVHWCLSRHAPSVGIDRMVAILIGNVALNKDPWTVYACWRVTNQCWCHVFLWQCKRIRSTVVSASIVTMITQVRQVPAPLHRSQPSAIGASWPRCCRSGRSNSERFTTRTSQLTSRVSVLTCFGELVRWCLFRHAPSIWIRWMITVLARYVALEKIPWIVYPCRRMAYQRRCHVLS